MGWDGTGVGRKWDGSGRPREEAAHAAKDLSPGGFNFPGGRRRGVCNLRKNCIPWALTAGDVLAGQEPRERGDLFGPPWQLVGGGRCDLG